ncbi:uncharacterized protein B0I36DRAFT_362971 [Microdochium trichocladiopsis]|uniref:Cryptic loci regulator 2 N-terminal domain-containing protein n=1 Tax=Microdochium trichocladiopsis TaxID=1682393 RepID=A0A9P8Y7Q7_9PEZI|nr:uncharacterized protein B0I36DRAFT_362971 [Microdochium trichocladiopsis]KAH7031253.1 hypothetical protein B0I36DRAFT_362971 [Microdochium trichocladiopsis]
MREREAHQWKVSRSDGKVQPRSIKSATGVRAPVPLEDPAYERWEFLAGNALRDLLYKPEDRLAGSDFFVEFPGNYEIYFEARAGKKDYYLYGHPSGDSYKAARDFVPHLFWLTTSSEDIKDCQCTLCKRSITEHARANGPKRKSSKTTTPKAATPSSNTATPVPAPAVPVTATPTSTAPNQPSTISQPAPAAQVPKPVSAGGPVPAQAQQPAARPQTTPQTSAQPIIQQPAQAPAPQASSAPPQQQQQQNQQPQQQQQQQQSQQQQQQQPQQRILPPSENVLFRDGEVVWFKNGPSWRLGIILQTTPTLPVRCLVKPLAHSALQIPAAPKAEDEMRPFLAFSVPAVSPSLVHLTNQPFNQIDWETQQRQIAQDDRNKRDLLGMEASKLAVMAIDESYSTFNRQGVPEPTPTRSFYGGVFLGSERLTAGEAVRIRPGPQEQPPPRPLPTVLSIKAIFVDSTSGTEQLYFYGDILRLEEVPAAQPPPQYTAQIPAAMVREKAFRDRVRAHAGVRHDWVPLPNGLNVMKMERDIRGRFYETERLMTVIDPVRLQDSVSKGEVVDVQAYLNNRMEAKRPYIGRRKNRSETVVGAVPFANLPLSFGPGIIED